MKCSAMHDPIKMSFTEPFHNICLVLIKKSYTITMIPHVFNWGKIGRPQVYLNMTQAVHRHTCRVWTGFVLLKACTKVWSREE